MTICHINLARGYRGGERQTELLIRELAEKGVSQRLLFRGGGLLGERLTDVPGLELRALDKPFLLRTAAMQGCTVVHAHEASGAQLAAVGARRFGLPYIITRRVAKVPRGNPFTRFVYRGAAAVVPISTAISAAVEGAGFPIKVTTPIPSAHAGFAEQRVDTSWRERYPDKFIIGHVGQLSDRYKGQGDLIAAAKILAEPYPEIQFVLVGDGGDREMFAELAEAAGNVDLLGQQEHVGNFLAGFDLFLFPSRNEGLGSTVIDAMTFGLPIITSDAGGLPDLTEHEKTGLIFPCGDVAAIVESIERLKNNPSLAASLGASAREKAANFSPALMADRYLALYRSLQSGN